MNNNELITQFREQHIPDHLSINYDPAILKYNPAEPLFVDLAIPEEPISDS